MPGRRAPDPRGGDGVWQATRRPPYTCVRTPAAGGDREEDRAMKLTFHHVNVSSHDVPGLDAFYGDVLLQEGIPQMESLPTLDPDGYAGRVMFRTDGQVQFHLAEMDRDVALRAGKAINPLDRGHLAFRTDDIAAFMRHLDAKGVRYVDYGTTFTKHWHQIFFHDPAGTVVEVHQVLDRAE
jgi:catechol 2,3-dioxygenase-like lactoylglutathione lyase family enzyme